MFLVFYENKRHKHWYDKSWELDEKWVAAYLNIKPNTLRKQRSVGVNYVPYSKIGGSVRYNKLKVMEYAESKGRKPNDR